MQTKPYFGRVTGKRTVPSWDVRTAPLAFVRAKYAEKAPTRKAA